MTYGDIITCLWCGKKSEDKNKYSPFQKKFCSRVCRGRFNSKKRYDSLKDDMDFKEKSKINFQSWYGRNKKKHIEKIMVNYYKKSGKGIMVIGLGVKETGIKNLAKLLGGCDNSSIGYEFGFDLPLALDLNKLKDKLILMDTKKEYYGDVGHYYLNYVEYLLAKVKNIKVICVFKDKQIGKTFSTFHKNYYSKIIGLSGRHPHKIKLIDTKLLESFDGQRSVFDFLGMGEKDRNYQELK